MARPRRAERPGEPAPPRDRAGAAPGAADRRGHEVVVGPGVATEEPGADDGLDPPLATSHDVAQAVVERGIAGPVGILPGRGEISDMFAVVGRIPRDDVRAGAVPDHAEPQAVRAGFPQAAEPAQQAVLAEVADVAGVAVLHRGSVSAARAFVRAPAVPPGGARGGRARGPRAARMPVERSR